MKRAIEVVQAGFNAIQQNGIEFKIVSGSDNILYVRENVESEILSIEVEKVQNFMKI